MGQAIKVKEIQRKLWENRGLKMSTEELTALLETKEGGVKQMERKKLKEGFVKSVKRYEKVCTALDQLNTTKNELTEEATSLEEEIRFYSQGLGLLERRS